MERNISSSLSKTFSSDKIKNRVLVSSKVLEEYKERCDRDAEEDHYVYWIYDKDNKCMPDINGYIGVAKDPYKRFLQHKRSKRFHDNIDYNILLKAPRSQCFLYEYICRPEPNIGWNKARGGEQGWKYGIPATDETKTKLKKSWTNERKKKASEFRKKLNVTLRGQKRPKQSFKMIGKNNPMYGKPRPNSVKEAISKANSGKKSWNKIESYCVGCHNRVSLSIVKKYHVKCYKKFYSMTHEEYKKIEAEYERLVRHAP